MSADTMTDAIALSSPSGHMSKRARRAAEKRLYDALFPAGIPAPTCPQSPEWERLRQTAAQLRDLAARGMKPRAYVKQAVELERQAAELEGV